MPSLDLARAAAIAHAGRNLAEVSHMGRAVWRQPLRALPTGGTITTATIDGVEYRIHTFAADGEFIAPAAMDVEYFLVGGGGRGRAAKNDAPRGGGAGGQVINRLGAARPLVAGIYPVTVGAEGASTTFFAETAFGGDNAPTTGAGAAQKGTGGFFGGASGAAGEPGGGGAGASGNGLDGKDGGIGGPGVFANPDGDHRYFARGGDGSFGGGGTDNPYAPIAGSGDGSGARRVSGSNTAFPGGDGIAIIRYRMPST